MAKSPYSVGFDISAKVNYSDINKANEAAGKLIEKLERLGKLSNGSGTAAGAISKQARTAANETEKLASQKRKLTNETKKAANAESDLKNNIKQTNDAGKDFNQTSHNVKTVGEQSKSAAGDMNVLQRSIKKVKSIGKGAFGAVSEHVQRLGEHSEATRKKLDRLNETGKRFRDAGYSMLPVSAALGASFLKGAKDATQLQHRYTIIRNLIKTGGESTAASIKNTRKMMSQGRDMSLKYGVSQNSIAKGYEQLVRRGYKSNQALAAQKTYLQGSIASGDKYSDVVTTAASAIESFGLKSNNTAKMTQNTKKAVNQMAYAADLTATSFSDLGEAMKFAGPDAYGAHQTLGQTSAAIGELSNSHIEGSQAGTSLRQIYQRLINPPQKGKAPHALQELGLSKKDFRDAKNNLLPIADIFDKLNSKMKGMSRTQRGGIYAALFGANASSAANVLGTHVKQLKELTKQVDKAQKQGKGGYVAGLSQKNLHSWQNEFKRFKASVDELGMSFAKSVLPTLTPMVDKLNKMVTAFGKLPKPMKQAIAYGTAFVALAGPLMVGVGSIASTAAVLGIGASKTGGGIGKLGKAFLPSALKDVGKSSTSTAADVLGGLSKGGKFLEGAKGLARRIPLLGTAISATSLIGINKHNAGRKIGDFGGTLAGMEGGAALGSFLGPVGTFVGGGLGAAAGSWLGSKAGKHIQDSFSNNSKAQSSKQVRRAYNPLNSLPKDARTTTKKALGYVEQANKGWIKTNYDTWSKSKHLSADYQSQSLIYDKLGKSLDRYVDRQQSSSNKSIGYLQKIGAIHAGTAKKTYSEEARWGSSRKRIISRDLQAIKNDEQRGGHNRAALVSRLNSDIVKITSKGSNKQRQIYRKLQNSTSNLSYRQYRSVLKYSSKAERETVASARKSYNKQVSAADATYRHTLKAAKQVYGVHSSEYRSIKKFAQRQYDKTTTAAEKQYEKTKYWAEQQRRKVVKQAKLQATEVANSLVTSTGKLGGELGKILRQNALAGLGTFPTRQAKNGLTNTIARHNRGNSHAKTANEATLPGLPTYSPGTATNSRRLTTADRRRQNKANSVGIQTLPGHANGGLITSQHNALVGEAGPELAYTVNGRKARILGAAGPRIDKVKPGERILNARDTAKVMSGGLGHTLPGYANGTSSLGRTAKTSDKDVKAGLNKVAKDYDSTTKKSKKSLDKFSKNSKSTWNGVSKDTKSSSQKIQKDTVGDYDDLQKNSVKQLSQLSNGSNSRWKSIQSQTGKRTNNLRKSTISDFNTMQQGSQKQMNQLESGIIAAAKATAIGFGKEMARMKGYAHAAMSGAIGQLNQGISGIDSVLGQFGGNHSVIKPIKYAHGSNGRLPEDQLAMVNDAQSGPRQEMIVRNNNLYIPQGNNRVLPLKKGDQVLNGRQTQTVAASYGIQHYAKGSGVSKSGLRKLIRSNNENSSKAFSNDFTDKLNSAGSILGRAVVNAEKATTSKYGKPWNKEVWSQMHDAMTGGGSAAGGAWRHSPGLKESDPFGASRAGMYSAGAKHDGVDFSGPLGAAIRAVHGGKVVKTGGTGISDLGKVIIVKSDDGFEEIYQEFGGMKNIKVGVGDTIRTGQKIATLGTLVGAGNGSHVHIGVTKGNPLHKNMLSTSGWYDVTKMHGKSSGISKKSTHKSALSKLVAKEIAPQLKWVGKHLQDETAGGGPVPKGDHMHWLEQAGMPRSWWPYVSAIINRESKWDPKADNPTSSAYGIPQALPGSKMRSAGSDWRTNPITQLKWMKSYIKGRYGSAQNAWRIRQTRGWYANGGWAGKASIFGEVAGEPEVAINPKRNTADNLIGQTIDARAKVDKNSPTANFLKSVKSLKTKPSKAKIEPHITINFNGDISDEKMMNNAADKMERKLTSFFQKLNDEFGLDDSVY